jgi:hypothetical protein
MIPVHVAVVKNTKSVACEAIQMKDPFPQNFDLNPVATVMWVPLFPQLRA